MFALIKVQGDLLSSNILCCIFNSLDLACMTLKACHASPLSAHQIIVCIWYLCYVCQCMLKHQVHVDQSNVVHIQSYMYARGLR